MPAKKPAARLSPAPTVSTRARRLGGGEAWTCCAWVARRGHIATPPDGPSLVTTTAPGDIVASNRSPAESTSATPVIPAISAGTGEEHDAALDHRVDPVVPGAVGIEVAVDRAGETRTACCSNSAAASAHSAWMEEVRADVEVVVSGQSVVGDVGGVCLAIEPIAVSIARSPDGRPRCTDIPVAMPVAMRTSSTADAVERQLAGDVVAQRVVAANADGDSCAGRAWRPTP